MNFLDLTFGPFIQTRPFGSTLSLMFIPLFLRYLSFSPTLPFSHSLSLPFLVSFKVTFAGNCMILDHVSHCHSKPITYFLYFVHRYIILSNITIIVILFIVIYHHSQWCIKREHLCLSMCVVSLHRCMFMLIPAHNISFHMYLLMLTIKFRQFNIYYLNNHAIPLYHPS